MKLHYSSLALIFCFITLSIFAEESDHEFNGSYKNIEKPTEYMASEFAKAKAENKKLIFVLGGNWCHDSRSLARKLQDAKLSKTIDDNFRISLIDVGYLNQGFEFSEKANKRTFYATPTVLIFDPETERQINVDDMHIWALADSVSQADANAYFDSYIGKITPDESKLTAAQETAMLKLQQFITIQEERIKSSYTVVGPLLEQYEAGDKNDKFEAYWKELSKLRMQLPEDIKSIQQQIASTSDAELASIKYPSYNVFTWE